MTQLFFFLIILSFVLTIVMHMVKKNVLFVWAYVLQSVALSVVLAALAFQTHELNFFIAALLTIAVKVVLAPWFLFKRIRIHQVYFTASSYINTPLTLVVVMLLIIFAHSSVFAPVSMVMGGDGPMVGYVPLIVSSVFISLFLMVNRKGAFSQIIGMLSLENAIILLSVFAGLSQSLTVELGIAFDSAIWVLIASLFLSLLHRHFGSLDVVEFAQLTEK